MASYPTPGQHDNKRAREVCANIASGEIVVFDKAYVDFDHLFDLNDRCVWWVTRAKDNMVFITNNLTWSPRSVCDLYRRRWDIEVFFKQVKQSLKLGSFLGHSTNAVRWQIYTALLVYVLLRFMGQHHRINPRLYQLPGKKSQSPFPRKAPKAMQIQGLGRVVLSLWDASENFSV